MEWVILDDGTESAADIVATFKDIPIQYVRSETKVNVGAKRNKLHELARGKILVTMDDDDYYSPDRVSHAVMTIRSRKANLVGSTRNFLYFTDNQSIWETGPYAPNHATFGTMAYTKEYATAHPCDETVTHAEELSFTKKYSEPLQQLDPTKVMLVMCHTKNTFSKHSLRDSPSPVMKPTSFKLRTFVKNAKQREFYLHIDS
jgi:glycosyltransferase involved in cell wall biosynthesis